MYWQDPVWILVPIWQLETKPIGIRSWGFAYLFAQDYSSLIILLEIVCRFAQLPPIILDKCPQSVVFSAAMPPRILGLRISQDYVLQSALLDLFLIIILKDVLLFAQFHNYIMAIPQPTNVWLNVLHIHNTMLIILLRHVLLFVLVKHSVRLLLEFARIQRTVQADISQIILQSFVF